MLGNKNKYAFCVCVCVVDSAEGNMHNCENWEHLVQYCKLFKTQVFRGCCCCYCVNISLLAQKSNHRKLNSCFHSVVAGCRRWNETEETELFFLKQNQIHI